MNDKAILRIIYGVSAFVLVVVVVLFNLPKAEVIPEFIKVLPKLNAIINGTCTLLLLTSLYFIKRKNISVHKKLNSITFFLSLLFFLSYITFHAFGVETKFPADNPIRPLYLFILLTHILSAVVVLPLVLLSFYRGLKGEVEKHKKIARWSFPIWLYVTFTGVVVYLMIAPYYSF